MSPPLLKPAFAPYVTPSELAVMLDQAAGGGTQWTTNNVRCTLRDAGALIPLPISGPARRGAERRGSERRGRGARWATTYELLQRHLPDIHRALVVAAPSEDIGRLLASVDGAE